MGTFSSFLLWKEIGPEKDIARNADLHKSTTIYFRKLNILVGPVSQN